MIDPARRRVLIRVVGAPLLLLALAGVIALDRHFQKPLGVIALLALFAIVSYRELCTMATHRNLAPAKEFGTLAVLVVFGVVWWGYYGKPLPIDLLTLVAGALLVLLGMVVLRARTFTPPDAGYSFLSLTYVLLLLFVVWPLETMSFGGWLWWLVFLVAACKGSDMAAYVCGRLFGRHKMAPTISPGKTWEGAIAGLVAGACLGAIVFLRTPLRNDLARDGGVPALGVALAGAAIVAAAGQLGDLVKSAVKRWAGVKDSGRLLPEFGGALDMCDSFLVAAPVAWCLLRVL